MLQKPAHLISLASSGVLVNVEMKIPTFTAAARSASAELTAAKKADKNAAKVTQFLLAGHPLHKALMNHRQTVDNWMNRVAFEWTKKQYFLPFMLLPKFNAEYKQLKADWDVMLQNFYNAYDGIISDMAFKQGDMFNRNAYPHRDKMIKRFSMELFTCDVPMQDYRCSIAQEIAEDLHETYSRQTKAIIDRLASDQLKRMGDVMRSISYCCETEEVTDDKGNVKTKKRRIYDATITKARDMINTFKEFNPSNNPEVEAARSELEQALASFTAEDIRESEAVRSIVKEGVDNILNKYAVFSSMSEEEEIDE
jgi:hypothetical protein